MRTSAVVWTCVLAGALFGCGSEQGNAAGDGGAIDADGSAGGGDSVAPAVGSAITFADVGATSAAVSWGEATDAVTPSDALKYRVVRASSASAIDTLSEAESVSGSSVVLDYTAHALSAEATSLTPATAYAFAVIVEDVAGNRALYAPATVTTLADLEPTLTIASPGTATSVTGAASIALAGTAADPAGVTSVSWANVTNGLTGVATGTSTWSIAAVPLAVGDNTIVVTATDATNNAGTASVVVTRDTAGPSLSITAPTDTTVTASASVAVTGAATDPAGIAAVTWVNATNMTSGTATGTTSWSIATVTLAAGSNTIEVTAADSVGNTTTMTVTVVRDNAAPAITIASPTVDPTFVTTAASIALAGSASDGVGLASVVWSNTTAGTTGSASGTTSWSVASIALVAGANTIVVTATDSAGNTSTDSLVVTRDNVEPAVAITTPTTSPTYVTSASAVALAGTASDASGVVSVTWTNQATLATGTAVGTASWSIGSVSLVTGANSVVVTATDAAGNTSTDTILVTRDATPPVIAISTPTTAATLIVRDATVVLGGSASDDTALASVTWANSTTATSGSATGTGLWTTSAIALAVGANELVVTATDTAGNTSTDVVTVTRDIAGPLVTITVPTSDPTFLTGSTSRGLGGSASDAAGVASVTWRNATTGETGTADGTTGWNVTAVALAPGANTIVVTGTDTVGNAGTDTIVVTRDVVGPTIAFTAPTTDSTYTSLLSTMTTLKGTASDPAGVVEVTWTNRANGDFGTASGTTTWSAPIVRLGAGSNPIVVSAKDSFGNVSTKTLTVTKNPTLVASLWPTLGSTHCALLVDGRVKCWGDNSQGQLGLGDSNGRGHDYGSMGTNLEAVPLGTGRTAVTGAVGELHSCAVLDDGSLKCWGRNGNGELGQGDVARRGDNPGELGDALPAIALGAGRTAIGVAAGVDHTCAILDNGSVKCWGKTSGNLLGFSAPGQSAIGDGPNEMGDALPALSLGTGRTAVALAASSTATCALLDNATVKCWGTIGGVSYAVPTGYSFGVSEPVAVLSAGYNVNICAVFASGTLRCTGPNNYGEQGRGCLTTPTVNTCTGVPALVDLGTGRTAISVSTGAFFSCALLDDSSVKCWGYNDAGQLGQGHSSTLGDQTGEMGDALPAIALPSGATAVDVSAGYMHSCVLLSAGTVTCWGQESVGQLGRGGDAPSTFTAPHIGNDPNEMGDRLRSVDL